MLKRISLIILSFLISALTLCCKNNGNAPKTKSFKINYLDEYILYNDSIFDGLKIGGLSGIEYHKENDTYYIVCDNSKKPRFYEASISIKKDTFSTLTINNCFTLKEKDQLFFDTNIVDLETLRTFGNDRLIFGSEGSIRNGSNPSIFITDQFGNYLDQFQLPSYFHINTGSQNQPRHNGVFEGLTQDHNKTGYWVAMELPLELDGPEPTIDNPGSPIRITHFDTSTKRADYQFTYPLNKLPKDPKGEFGVNGVTGLIQLSSNQFLVIERGYAAGYGTQGNSVRLYLANNSKATNTLDQETLNKSLTIPAKKTLLFDFESIRNQLTENIVDNIEGITLGPKLSNGNQSLILVSDNNFNPTSEQINQFILLELIHSSEE